MQIVIYLAVFGFVFAGWWMSFVKAGQPGWAAIVPIYNVYILTKIAKKPGIWVLFLLIPIVNLVILVLLSLEVARQFGKGSGFGVGLALLGFIFWPILGFGDAKYLNLPARAS